MRVSNINSAFAVLWLMVSILLAVSLLDAEIANANGIDRGKVGSVPTNAAPEEPKSVHIVDQDVAELIREAARREGLEVTISRKVRGRIQRKTLPLDVKAIMRELSPQFDLKWHFQQNHIFVSTSPENTTRLVYLGAMDMADLESAMETAGIKSDTFEMSHVEESNSVLINGSASYIASIELLADAFNKNAANRKSNVRVIRYGRVGS